MEWVLAIVFYLLATCQQGDEKYTTLQVIKKHLWAWDMAKSMGQENIPNVRMKACTPELAAALAKLLQFSKSTGINPKIVKIISVRPVHKINWQFTK